MKDIIIKFFALAFVGLMVLYIGHRFFRSSGAQETAQQNSQTKAYYEYLERQEKAYDEHLAKVNAQLDFANKINSKSMENQERFEKLLDRWEKQSEKVDEILFEVQATKK